jgi:hypothetical protein
VCYHIRISIRMKLNGLSLCVGLGSGVVP